MTTEPSGGIPSLPTPPGDAIPELTSLFSSGQFGSVVERATRLTREYPQNAFFWKALGSSLQQLGRLPESMASFERALCIDSRDCESLLNYGVALHVAGRDKTAKEQFERAVAISPDFGEAYYNLGNVNADMGLPGEAGRFFRVAVGVDQGHCDAWRNLGNVYKKTGNFEGLEDCARRVVCLRPAEGVCLVYHGTALRDLRRVSESLIPLSRALLANPLDTEARAGFALSLDADGQIEAAVREFRIVLALNPGHLKTLNNIGITVRKAGRFDDAAVFFGRALSISPEFSDGYNNRAVTYREMKLFEGALVDVQRSISLKPASEEAWTNHGVLLQEMGCVEDCVERFSRAFVLNPSNASAKWNASLAMLSLGGYSEGWNLHEYRFEAEAVLRRYPPSVPIERKSPLPHARVLIWGEQGLGDEVMFGSMIADALAAFDSVIIQLDPRLLSLFERSFSGRVVFKGTDVRIRETDYDFALPLGSLGRLFRLTKESFSLAAKGYLRTDGTRVRGMKDAIGPTNGRPIIGLSWRSTNAETGGSRSLELSEIIAGVQKRAPSAILVNLQYGYVQPEISRAFDETGVLVRQIPGLDVTSDLDGLAALIKSCDHVISIGNTTAHLAGALGTKTQVMLPFAASWRWMASGTQTPWYESLKLHRRGSHLGSWSSVIDDATRSAVECIRTRS